MADLSIEAPSRREQQRQEGEPLQTKTVGWNVSYTNPWRHYEAQKRQLAARGLSAEAYEQAVRRAADELEI